VNPSAPKKAHRPQRSSGVVRVLFGVLLFAVLVMGGAGTGCDDCRSDGAGVNTADDLFVPERGVTFEIRDARSGALVPALVTLVPEGGRRLHFGNVIDRPGWGQGTSAKTFAFPASGLTGIDKGLVAFLGRGTLAVGLPHTFLGPFQKQTLTQSVPPGRYTAYFSRGPGYNVETRRLDLSAAAGVQTVEVGLQALTLTEFFVSGDFHVHTAEGSGDAGANAEQQLKLAAAVGLDVVVTADHERAVDLPAQARAIWPHGHPFARLLPGLESALMGAHLAVFPVGPNDPSLDTRLMDKLAPSDATGIMSALGALPSKPLVQVVHGRLGWAAYFDSGLCGPWAAKDRAAPPPCPQNYDLLEVLYSWDLCSSRVRTSVDDWYALMRHGIVKTGVGNSDAHFVSGHTVGTPRTWIHTPRGPDGKIQSAALIKALRDRHTTMSSGPLVRLSSDSGQAGDLVSVQEGGLKVRVEVQAADYVPADWVELRLNGKPLKSWALRHTLEEVAPRIRLASSPLAFEVEWAVPVPSADAFVTAEVRAAAVLPDRWASLYHSTPGFGFEKCPPAPGQPAGTVSFAVTSPLFLDVDGDGLFQGDLAAEPVALP